MGAHACVRMCMGVRKKKIHREGTERVCVVCVCE